MYSDLLQAALKYLKDTEANINNVLILTGDFNIRDNIWDSNFSHYSIHSNLLTNVAEPINLYMSKFTNQVPTRYSDNQNDSNSVINLMFLRLGLSEFNNHTIHSDWRLLLDYAPLTVDIVIIEENIQTSKYTLVKNREEKENFITELTRAITRLNIENIQSKEILEQIVQTFTNNMDRIWFKHSKVINITKHFKA